MDVPTGSRSARPVINSRPSSAPSSGGVHGSSSPSAPGQRGANEPGLMVKTAMPRGASCAARISPTVQRCLARTVRGAAEAAPTDWQVAAPAAHVHDPAGAPLDDTAQHGWQQDTRQHVHLEDVPPLAGILVLPDRRRIRRPRDAGVVHEHVDRAELALGLLDHARHRGVVRNVNFERQAANLLCHLLDLSASAAATATCIPAPASSRATWRRFATTAGQRATCPLAHRR